MTASTTVGPTTIVQPDAAVQTEKRDPRELPVKSGSAALAQALSNLRHDVNEGTLKLDGSADAGIIEAGGVVERERALQKAAQAPPGADAGTDEGDAGAAADDGAAPDTSGLTQDAQGRWHDASGKFVKADGTPEDEPDPNAPASAAAAKPAAADDDAQPDAQAIVVKIPGHESQPELELEVSDPAIAERINELTNNGMRKAEFTRRLEAIEARELDLRSQEAIMEKAPEAHAFERLPAAARVELGKAILAAHWDDLYPTLVEFAKDGPEGAANRKLALSDVKDKVREAKTAMEGERANQRAAMKIINAVKALIPENTPDDTVNRFIRLADSELGDKIRGGTQVTAENVKDHLAPVLRDFRFEQAAPAAGDTTTKTQRRPASPPAKAPAAKGASSPRTTDQQSEDRKRSIATARNTARRVAPAGAGGLPAAPVQIPKGVGLKDAFKFVRENPGVLSVRE